VTTLAAVKVDAVANQCLTCSEEKPAAQDAYFPALIASWIRILPSYWLQCCQYGSQYGSKISIG